MVDQGDRQTSLPVEVSRSENNGPNAASRRLSTRSTGSLNNSRRVSGTTAQALASTSRPRSLFDSDGNITSLNILNPNLSPAASTRRHNRGKDSSTASSPKQPQHVGLRVTAAQSETPQRSSVSTIKQTAKKIDVAKSRTAPPELPMQRKKRRKEESALSVEPVDPSPGPKRRKASPVEQKPIVKQKKQQVIKVEPTEKRSPSTKAANSRRGASRPAKPLTPLELKRAEFIAEREKELQSVVSRHDSTVREMFFLEVHQSMLDYDPVKWKLNREDRLMQASV
jgi:hypothetical protein